MRFDFRSNLLSGNAAKKALIAILALLNLIFFCPNTTFAQLDPTFGTNGVSATNISGPPTASFVLPDGKIFVVVDDFGAPLRFVRFNSDGTPDATYGTGGVIEPVVPYATGGNLYSAVRQSDGKIVLAGYDGNFGFITRFTENGTLDTTFASGGVHRTNIGSQYDQIFNLILLPDGKILGVGTSSNNSSEMRYEFLIRYSADGILDTTFGGGNGYIKHEDITWFPGLVDMKVLRQSDGKLLVYRNLTEEFPNSARIRRFNDDGTLDNTYPGIYLHGSFKRIILQPDDKLLAAGNVTKTETFERTNKDISVSRYTTSGTLDSSFGNGGNTTFDLTSYFYDEPRSLLVMPDGQILVSLVTFVPLNRSAVTGYKLGLARLSANGTAVTGEFLQANTSGPVGSYSLKNGYSHLSILPDGKILTVHHWENSGARLLLTRAVGVPVVTYRFHGTPFDFLYGSPLTSEPTVYRPSEQRWYTRFAQNNFPAFGLPGDIPAPSDYLGSFETDLTMFRPSNGTWYIAKTSFNPATNFIAIQWGLSGDVPAPADFDGDGKSDIAVFRPSDGVWYIRNSFDSSARILQWGLSGDKPVAGDYDGDGIFDVAVWRPSDGVWYILRSSDGGYTILHFGLNGDVPVQDDFDGDGKTDIAVWRPSSGDWYILKSSDGGVIYFHWGASGDIAVPADYDGDLKTDIAVWRPNSGRWYIFRSSDNAITEISWGTATDIPAQGRN